MLFLTCRRRSCWRAKAEMTPAKPRIIATRMSAFRFVRLRTVPITAVGTITNSDVPLAMAAGMPKPTTIAGTMMIPPPTPRSPARMPVASPIEDEAR